MTFATREKRERERFARLMKLIKTCIYWLCAMYHIPSNGAVVCTLDSPVTNGVPIACGRGRTEGERMKFRRCVGARSNVRGLGSIYFLSHSLSNERLSLLHEAPMISRPALSQVYRVTCALPILHARRMKEKVALERSFGIRES